MNCSNFVAELNELPLLLTFIFVILKLTGLITWSWHFLFFIPGLSLLIILIMKNPYLTLAFIVILCYI